MTHFDLLDVALLIQVLLIDLTLSGRIDSALVATRGARLLGAALGLAARLAVALAIANATAAPGLRFIGGFALIWIAWRIVHSQPPLWRQRAVSGDPLFAAAATLALSDLALSLDATVAIGGVGRHGPPLMAFALLLSALLTSVAGDAIARFMGSRRWITALAVAAILAASLLMIWEDLHIWFPTYVPAIANAFGGMHHA